MKQRKFTLVAIAKQSAFAMVGLVLATTVASAITPTRLAGDSAGSGMQQPVRLAEAVAVTKPKYVKAAGRSHKVVRRSGKTWLNPQPEPPMGPAKVGTGGNWLNPQPEPPRPVTPSRKLHQ